MILKHTREATNLLIELIKIQSFSEQEENTADLIELYLKKHNIPCLRLHNNIIAKNQLFSHDKPSIILNSHHDTVKVVSGWQKDPFGAMIEKGKLYGLGSNDAGASLVSLLATFMHFYQAEMEFNLVWVASAEEENFGAKGMSLVLQNLDFDPVLGIIGEPTEMHMAITEKGLIVIDGVTTGRAGHVARDLGTNAIYMALDDIQWIRAYRFKKTSKMLGEVKLTVSQIDGGFQHNVIPDKCHYVLDVRVNEQYSNEEIVKTLQLHCGADLKPRSLKWQPSKIDWDHPIVQKGITIGRECFGSPTLSDQVHFTCPTLKMGPGRSERSHTADEYIHLDEIAEGVDLYITLLTDLKL